jgi:rubrerythrin
MLDMRTDADGLADFLLCLSALENKNSQLFKGLAEKIVLPSVKPQLSKIAEDNEKHSKCLQKMGERIGNPKVRTKECKKKLSVVCENTEIILKQVQEKKEISLEDLTEYLRILESAGGAAQFLLVQAETFLFMCNEIKRCYGMNADKFNELLNEIVQDIEEHIILLEEIKKIVDHEQHREREKHPLFRYQSPDSWLTPSHSQKTGHVI